MTPALIQQERPNREFAESVLTGGFRYAVEQLPKDIAAMSEAQIEELRKPTDIDYFLRKSLWKQIELAQKGIITDISQASIYSGICSKQNFDQLCDVPLRVAWLLIYPESVNSLMEHGLSLAIHNLLKFVAKAPTPETASAFIKATELLLNRVQGPIIQKIQAQHAHLNMNKPIQVQQDPDKRLAELKSKIEERNVTPQNAIEAKAE